MNERPNEWSGPFPMPGPPHRPPRAVASVAEVRRRSHTMRLVIAWIAIVVVLDATWSFAGLPAMIGLLAGFTIRDLLERAERWAKR